MWLCASTPQAVQTRPPHVAVGISPDSLSGLLNGELTGPNQEGDQIRYARTWGTRADTVGWVR